MPDRMSPPPLRLVSDVEPPLAELRRRLDHTRAAFALCDETHLLGGNRAFEALCGVARDARPTRLDTVFRDDTRAGTDWTDREDRAVRVASWDPDTSLRLLEFTPRSAVAQPSPLDRDPVSGLLSPAAFEVEYETRVAAAMRSGTSLVLFHLDFPEFESIARGRGCDARLAFLRATGDRLARHGGRHGLAMRVEGARYALLLANPRGGPGAAIEMERLETVAASTETLEGGTEGVVRPRIGMALMPDDTQRHLSVLGGEQTGRHLERFSETAASLRSCAELSLGHALENPGSPRVRFAPELVIAKRRREQLARGVNEAVTNGEMRVAFQPVMDVSTLRLVGFEALLRWRHPEYGPVPPPEAVAIAEANGALCALTRRVMNVAIDRCREWPAHLTFAINVTPTQLNEHLVALIAEELERTAIDPRRLEIEVTEDALIRDLESSARVIDAIRALGVRVAMDDFGAGFTSLRNLKSLAFDKIKIDRSLCEGLGRNERTGVIVGGLVRLADRLGIEATVEGVETDEQLSALEGLPCLVQGYVFSPPVPHTGMEAFRPWLSGRDGEAQRSRPAAASAAS